MVSWPNGFTSSLGFTWRVRERERGEGERERGREGEMEREGGREDV